MFEFIEAPFFTKSLDRYLDDDEYLELQAICSSIPSPEKWFQDPGVCESFVGAPKGVESAAVCG